MKIDREEDKCFYLRLIYVFISHSANKGMSMENMQKRGQIKVE